MSPLQAPLASSYSSYVAGPVVQCEVEGTQENVEGIKSVIVKLHEYYGCKCGVRWSLWEVSRISRWTALDFFSSLLPLSFYSLPSSIPPPSLSLPTPLSHLPPLPSLPCPLRCEGSVNPATVVASILMSVPSQHHAAIVEQGRRIMEEANIQ